MDVHLCHRPDPALQHPTATSPRLARSPPPLPLSQRRRTPCPTSLGIAAFSRSATQGSFTSCPSAWRSSATERKALNFIRKHLGAVFLLHDVRHGSCQKDHSTTFNPPQITTLVLSLRLPCGGPDELCPATHLGLNCASWSGAGLPNALHVIFGLNTSFQTAIPPLAWASRPTSGLTPGLWNGSVETWLRSTLYHRHPRLERYAVTMTTHGSNKCASPKNNVLLNFKAFRPQPLLMGCL